MTATGNGNPMAKVKAGDKLRVPADAYNAFIDAAIAERARGLDRGGGDLRPLTHRANVVPVKNDTTAALPRFSVLGIDGPLLDPDLDPDGFKGAIVLRGVAPTAAHAASGALLITTEPIAAGTIGWAVVSGAAICQVNVVDEAHLRATAVVDYTGALQSGPGGLPILWREGGTGTQWAVVCVGSIGLEASLPTRYIARVTGTDANGDALWAEQDTGAAILPADKTGGMTGSAKEINRRKWTAIDTIIEVYLLDGQYWYSLSDGPRTYPVGSFITTMERYYHNWNVEYPVTPGTQTPSNKCGGVAITVLATKMVPNVLYPEGVQSGLFWATLTFDANGNLRSARAVGDYYPP